MHCFDIYNVSKLMHKKKEPILSEPSNQGSRVTFTPLIFLLKGHLTLLTTTQLKFYTIHAHIHKWIMLQLVCYCSVIASKECM